MNVRHILFSAQRYKILFYLRKHKAIIFLQCHLFAFISPFSFLFLTNFCKFLSFPYIKICAFRALCVTPSPPVSQSACRPAARSCRSFYYLLKIICSHISIGKFLCRVHCICRNFNALLGRQLFYSFNNLSQFITIPSLA